MNVGIIDGKRGGTGRDRRRHSVVRGFPISFATLPFVSATVNVWPPLFANTGFPLMSTAKICGFVRPTRFPFVPSVIPADVAASPNSVLCITFTVPARFSASEGVDVLIPGTVFPAMIVLIVFHVPMALWNPPPDVVTVLPAIVT